MTDEDSSGLAQAGTGVEDAAALIIFRPGPHILEGLTAPGHEVKIVEEEVEDINLDAPCDLVGISCMTANAPRPYRLGDEFRRQGRKVVLGGVQASLLPDEAMGHVDAVVVGEAEGIWNEALADASSGALKHRQHHLDWNLGQCVPVRKGSFVSRSLFKALPAMTTQEAGGKKYLFLDDNIIGDRRYARELFAGTGLLGIERVGQAAV